MYIDLATCGLLAIFPRLFLVAARNDERDFFYLFQVVPKGSFRYTAKGNTMVSGKMTTRQKGILPEDALAARCVTVPLPALNKNC
jgi:hypothetical protein